MTSAFYYLPKRVGPWRMVEHHGQRGTFQLVYEHMDDHTYALIEQDGNYVSLFVPDDCSHDQSVVEIGLLFNAVNDQLNFNCTHVNDIYEGGLTEVRIYGGLRTDNLI